MQKTHQPLQPLYNSVQKLAVDGSDLHIPTNPKDIDSYFAKTNEQRPYNLLHLNALYDVCSKVYTDTIIQKSRVSNENQALIDMVDRDKNTSSTLILADRGYESYNALAHIQEKGWKFLIDLHLSAGRTETHWELYKNKNQYKRISHPENFDYFVNEKGERDIYKFYHLPFRILKIKLDNNAFETIITNLPADEFALDEIKKLYSMRWGIETSFRDLKYPLGLLHFHSKKTELVYQEIYAHLLMYNFVSLMITGQNVQCKNRKHNYKSSFSMAIHASRLFFREIISQETVIMMLSKYLTPIRPDRKAVRRKKKERSVMSFNYRLA